MLIFVPVEGCCQESLYFYSVSGPHTNGNRRFSQFLPMNKILFALLFIAFGLPVLLPAQTIGTFSSVTPASQDELFHIPSTHRWQLLMQTGLPLSAGGTMPVNADFTGYIPIQGSSENGYLAVNSEHFPGGMTILDIQFDNSGQLWSVTASEAVDFSALGDSSVSGTVRNCSGGITPWGTVVTCEEHTPGTDLNGDGYFDWGWNIEVDPVTRQVMDYENDNQIDKLWAMGQFKHENVAVAADSITVYQGEDNSANGFMFKYIADQPGNLSSGSLYVLQTTGANGTWIQIPNTTQADRNDTPNLATLAGGTQYWRVEDVEIGPDGKIYFASTSTGNIYRFRDDGNTVSQFEVFVDSMAYPISSGSGTVNATFNWPDNLAFDGEGNLWVTQDGGRKHVWVIAPGHTTASPQIRVFANTPFGCEPTGITFSPNYRFMFMSLQHPADTNSQVSNDAGGNSIVFNKDATIVIARSENLGPAVGISEIKEDKTLKLELLHPNPVGKGPLQFEVQAKKGGAAIITVVEVLGRVTLSAERYLSPGINDLELDVDRLPVGQYVLLVETAEGKVSQVFIRK
jgi:hypothetical protein